MRRIVAGVALAITGVLAIAFTVSGATTRPPASYVVVLQDGMDVASTVSALEGTYSFAAEHRYSASINGFAATLASRQRDALEHDAAVVSVHEDRALRLAPPSRPRASIALSTGVRRIGAGANAARGVAVAVLDTGVDLSHPDVAALPGTNCTGGARRRASAVSDGNGHGTHVAGTIAGKNGTGVAPGTTVYAVKVLDEQGHGTTSALICGIDWVTANAAALGIRVASLSLGTQGSADSDCGRSSRDVLHKAICHAVVAGVLFVVAAGNDAADIDGYVPAGYPEVLAVTAMSDTDGEPGGRGRVATCGERERDDTAATFSNYAGSGSSASHVIAGPGVCIRSTWTGGGYRTISGTSMAAPHVSAAAALCIASGRCRGDVPAIIRQLRADAATHGSFAGDEHSPLPRRHYGDLVWGGY